MAAAGWLASLHQGRAAEDPWHAQGFLGMAVACVGIALVVLAGPRPAPCPEPPLPEATPWRVYRALLAFAAVLVASCVHDSLPHDRYYLIGYSSLALAGVVALVLLPASIRSAMPLRVRRADLVLAAGVGILCAGAAVFVRFRPDLPPWIRRPDTDVRIVQNLLLAPLCEELLDRGVLWRVCRRLMPVAPTVLATTVVFTLGHQWLQWNDDSFLAIAGIAACGAAFGLLRARTGSVAPGMLAHGIVNGLPWLLAVQLPT